MTAKDQALTSETDIPNMPSDAELESRIYASGEPLTWRPFKANAEELARSGKYQVIVPEHMSPERQRELQMSRLRIGPGDDANEFQHAVHDTMLRTVRNAEEIDRLNAKLAEVSGYDSQTGEPKPAYTAEARKEMAFEVQRLEAEIAQLQGESGRRQLNEALKKAVANEKARLRERHIAAEAERRADEIETERRIEERAQRIAAARRSQDTSARPAHLRVRD